MKWCVLVYIYSQLQLKAVQTRARGWRWRGGVTQQSVFLRVTEQKTRQKPEKPSQPAGQPASGQRQAKTVTAR
jgi:hypothetical protein